MRVGDSQDAIPLNRSLLLVEPLVLKRERLYDLFTDRGCAVTAVQSGALALSALKALRPDVVLADTALPDMSGWQLAERIRAFDTHVPIVLCGLSHTPPGPIPATLNLRAFLPHETEDAVLLREVLRHDAPPAPRAADRWPGRVLVVDDEPKLREVLRTFLELHGFTVETAASGEEALARVAAGGLPTVVLLDVQMPGMDGVLTLKKLRALTPHVPVIMLSGLEDERAIEAARELGASDYVLKPFNLDYLQTVVLSKLLAERGAPAANTKSPAA